MSGLLENKVTGERDKNESLKNELRRLTFREAGIDPTSPWGKALDRLYSGPVEAEAIREFAASEYGIGEPTEPQEQEKDERDD